MKDTKKVSLFLSDHFFLVFSLFLNTANNNNHVAASDDVVSLEGAFTNYVDKKRWVGGSRLVI